MALKPPIHGRDHCPTGADPIPCLTRPWIVLENLGQTLASGSFKHSLFTDAYWDPGLVSNPQDDTDDLFVLNLESEDGNDYWELTTRHAGWFTLEYVHLWSNLSALSTSPAYGSQQIQFNTSNISFYHDRQPGSSADWSNAVNELDGSAYLHTYRTIYLASQKIWPAMVKQTTGDNRDCSGHLKVWYEREISGTSNEAWGYANVAL